MHSFQRILEPCMSIFVRKIARSTRSVSIHNWEQRTKVAGCPMSNVHAGSYSETAQCLATTLRCLLITNRIARKIDCLFGLNGVEVVEIVSGISPMDSGYLLHRSHTPPTPATNKFASIFFIYVILDLCR